MRRTGKTFRSLLEAIFKASEGYSVHYIAYNHAIIRYLEEKVINVIEAGEVSNIIEHKTYESIVFKNGGSIKFHSGQNKDIGRGEQNSYIVDDSKSEEYWSVFK